MKRYVISPIVGNGTFLDPQRAAVSDVSQTNTSSIIPTNPNGMPKYEFALSIVGTANLPGVLAVSNSLVFPDYPLDGQMSGMEGNAANDWAQSLEAFDLDGNGLNFDASFDPGESWRVVINRIGQQLEPVFNVNNFDAQEPQI